MMSANDEVHKRKAKPRALHRMDEAGLDTDELLEDTFQMLDRKSVV